MPFLVASYNVLATAYIRPERYSCARAEHLRPEWRIPAVVEHVRRLDADVVCLQEVDAAMFAALRDRLAADGYDGELAKKRRGQPDGCALFVRRASAELVRVIPLVYADATAGGRDSGHVAQIAVVSIADRRLGIANTHLKWDPSTAPDDHIGVRQIRELLARRSELAPECRGWIVCGDLNAARDSAVVAALTAAGFSDSHASLSNVATCNANRRAQKVDYLFHDAALSALPLPVPDVRDDTPLPSVAEPSDHVAVQARLSARF